MLEFNVENQIIKRIDSFLPVADSRNYLKAEFKMTEEWQGAITAVFGYGGSYFRVLLDGDNCCTVPWEVIKAPHFTVSLFCGDESLITANSIDVLVEPSGMKEGAEPLEPTPEIWQQYMAKMQQNIENAVPYIGENGNWYFYNAELGRHTDSGMLAAPEKGVDYFDGKNGIDGKDGSDGYTPQKGVDYWTDADKAEIKAYVAPFIVNVTVYTDGTIELDKTDSEISSAYNDGKTVLAYVEYYGGNKGDVIISQGKEVQILTLVRYEWITRYKFWFTSIDSTDTEAYQVTTLWNEGAKMDWGGNIVDNGWRIETVSISSKEYVDTQIGDIETALDSIIAIQNQLMGVSE